MSIIKFVRDYETEVVHWGMTPPIGTIRMTFCEGTFWYVKIHQLSPETDRVDLLFDEYNAWAYNMPKDAYEEQRKEVIDWGFILPSKEELRSLVRLTTQMDVSTEDLKKLRPGITGSLGDMILQLCVLRSVLDVYKTVQIIAHKKSNPTLLQPPDFTSNVERVPLRSIDQQMLSRREGEKISFPEERLSPSDSS